MKINRVFVFVWAAAVLALLPAPAPAQTFSVAPGPGGPGTPSVSGIPPDGIFTFALGPVLPGAGPVFGPGISVNTDGFSYGEPFGAILEFYFSVDPLSVGAPLSAVAAEAAGGAGGPGDHPADIYVSPFASGLNFLLFDGNGLANPGLAPPIGLVEPFPTPGDNVDGFEIDFPSPAGAIFFTVDPFSLGPPPGFGDAASIFVGPAIPGYDFIPPAGLFAGAAALGLIPFSADNVDALVVFDDGDFVFDGIGVGGDLVLFSLAPGAASFGAAGPYLGASPADILFAGAAGAGVLLPAGALGLLPSDNLDALDVRVEAIPEPASAVMLLAGMAGVILFRRRR